MSGRIARRFAQLQGQGRAGLIVYVMASDPDPETSFEILRRLAGAGADLIELGFPFSDPMADGLSIQRAGERALKAGGSLRATLALAARFRAEDQTTPLILMGYCNPVEQMGYAAFAQGLAAAGADGAILVDLPPEEDGELRGHFAHEGLALIRLATPTTDAARLGRVLDGAGGFLYYVSVTGVTGTRAIGIGAARAAVARLKAASDLPVAVGFGVRTPEAAAAIAEAADAVVVGSALVDVIGACVEDGALQAAPGKVAASVEKLAEAVRGARTGPLYRRTLEIEHGKT